MAEEYEKCTLKDCPLQHRRQQEREVWRLDPTVNRQMTGTCFTEYILDLG
jgi:hypothetical protein